MKKIKISDKVFILVDDDKYDYINQWKWKLNNSGYARRTLTVSINKIKKYKTIYLHRILFDIPKGKEVDHVNRDKLDCRIQNLRLVTHSQNHWNKDKQSNNKSGFKGVSFSKQRNKWVAYIKVDSKVINLGGFLDVNDANIAYNDAVNKYFNFI